MPSSVPGVCASMAALCVEGFHWAVLLT